MRDSEVVDKAREIGSIGMIIGEILCLFAYIACPLFLLPLEWWSQPQIDYAVTSIWVALHRITTELDSGTGRSSSVRHHGTSSILGGE